MDEVFDGEISYVNIYNKALTEEDIDFLNKNPVIDPKPKGLNHGVRYTVDNRFCLKECAPGNTPGKPGSRPPPAGAVIGGPGSGGDDDNGSFKNYILDLLLKNNIYLNYVIL